MANNTNSSANDKSSSADNDDTEETLWQQLFTGKGGVLLLGVGAFLILCNFAVFVGIDTRPNAWLCYLDMRYWSGYVSIALWIAAIWVASESTDIVEDYLPLIRISMVICILLVMIFALRSFFHVTHEEYSLWFDAVIVIAVCCAVRSVWLLYDYRYEGEASIDVEEAQWFWGWSGCLLIGLLILGVMHLIPVQTNVRIGADSFVTESLFLACYNGLLNLIRTGHGSFAIQAFGLLVFVASIAFVYVAGKWMLIFLSRIRGE